VFESGPETLDEIARVLKIDDGVLRHLATKHVEGSRTSAPRDEFPAPTAAPVAAPAAPVEPEPVASAEPDAEPEPEAEPVAVAAPESTESDTSSEEEE
jgi:hypothetical protein